MAYEQNSRLRLAWMDNLRAILIVALLFLHVTSNESIASLASPNSIVVWDALNKALTPFRMPIFFFVSGVLSASTIKNGWWILIKKSTLRFVYLSLLWGGLSAGIVVTIQETLDAVLLLDVIAESVWFLAALALYIPITKLLSNLSAYLPPILGIASFAVSAPFVSTHFSALSSISFYFFYFTMGVLLSNYLRVKALNIRWKTIFSSATLFLISAFLMKQAPVGVADTISRFLANGFATILGVSVSIKLLNQPIRSLTKLGRNTIGIYLVHSTILILFSKFLVEYLLGAGITKLDDLGSSIIVLAFITSAVFVTFVIKNVDNYCKTYILTDPFSNSDNLR